ncbi:clathrin associated protein complex large subunit, partial [Coemansia sp. RSA 2706]
YADLLVPADSQASANDSANASAGLDADGLDILGALGAPVSTGDKSLAPGDEPLDLDADLPQPAPAPAAVVRLLASVARAPAVSPAARHMALTALAKAAGRFAALPAVVASVRAALAQHTHAVDAELQARAAEFDALLRRELDPVRAAVVERMPPPEYAEVPYDEYVLNPAAMRMKALTLFRPPELIAADPAADPAGDSAARAEASRQSVVSDLLNLMDEAPTSAPISAPTSPPQPAVAYPVFHQHGLRLTLTPSKRAAHVVDLRADFTNTGDSAVSGLAFQVAVPKSQKIQIHPPSGQHISAGSSVSQLLRVSNPTQAQLRLRMKIAFTADAQTHEHMLDFSGFPSTVV